MCASAKSANWVIDVTWKHALPVVYGERTHGTSIALHDTQSVMAGENGDKNENIDGNCLSPATTHRPPPTRVFTSGRDEEVYLIAYLAEGPLSFRIGAGIVVGRGVESEARLPSATVSRLHARVLRRRGEVAIEDLGSANGTWVNGRRLPRHELVTIDSSSALRIGHVHCTIDANALTNDTPVIGSSSKERASFVVHARGMREVVERVRAVADSDLAVLLYGETGVGKERMASMVHEFSKRKKGPFVKVNCAAIPESLFESELFGHAPGAFTGANSLKKGLLETANGGTLFLDEVGEMPLATQAKLLRALETSEILRLGSVKPTTVDVRVVSATNRDLPIAVRSGQFRADLLYRLRGVPIYLPPLRERPDDLIALMDFFVEKHADAMGRSPPVLAPETITMLRAYAWPGNVRELSQVIERSLWLTTGPVFLPEHVDLGAAGSGRPENVDTPTPPAGERETIIRALEQTGGNQTRAAVLLGVSRGVLITRIRKYGLARPTKR